MITGASQADAAILVISAEEGIQDQTKQHTYLAKILGIEQLIVAVNKMDKVNYDQTEFKQIFNKLNRVLNSLSYKKVPIIPLSTLEGDNISEKSEKMSLYNGPIFVDALDQNLRLPIIPADKPLRGFVQDICDTERGKVIICKIETGTAKTGKEIVFSPCGQKGLNNRYRAFRKKSNESSTR